ncbi:MAG: 3,4-dihydroxy-2-butanone 4-phosphate synthase [Candidatus Methanoperedens nitroreducens]|uniref:3,4-dihydroxy-2-butanone 4-phosphate synthase n=1 Tax=Candidatus Methanoperedens nitratireducens TaxID=1392998 RepID=A0A0N8KRE4_9EURY|nr:3,4-dihydroxy-2-butanone-4-phosphate synthase [Candidatus Methanoperedens sp. BLZ2]KAB2947150.1 MAG: 3,4-dihydroxy-2-butanone-4-phosphate synthase [Candidatus Methanoperedens sp.]KPQ44706.1 MAG: 3,4-dihydroxy-2-butanone 4-phosphate synthase [Candidatus Methanoperedens sp. BLZ1]MBZ0176954.1 3,4-dihydroxy-2-butanone-4-phosphate synthase [Candidatus Methanoperedens nitroreducens]CAG0951590.1 3,4-dihydroxy 2-butanone 4-phosphate synthase [Methanosarcinales archaeon]MCX9078020.1 3,4-dihydroxy-2-
MSLDSAIDALRNGKMILLFDAEDREGETDLVIPAICITPSDVALMRRDGGGLICVAIYGKAADSLGLPFMSDILRSVSKNGHKSLISLVEKKGDIPYDSRSSFSLWVNHRETFTGITDNDRALTIRKVGETVDKVMKGEKIDFGDEFRSPGHVALLRAAAGLLTERRGQTELSIELALKAGISPSMVVCEMLDDKTGKALTKEDAIKYSKEKNMPFIEGKDL